jgi:integrase
MRDSGLEPIAPEAAVEWYLDHRQDELREATRRTHRSSLGIFVEWTEQAEIEDLNELGGRDLVEFKTWRKAETDVNRVSLNGILAVLQRFLRFCERIDAVEEDLTEKVPLPDVPPDEEVKTDVPGDEQVEAIRSYCRRFEYASRRHVQFELVAEIGIRLGALRAIDIDDVHASEAVIHLRHRPEMSEVYGTPLKNGADGERVINLSPELARLLEDYIAQNRADVRDEFDRKPLFTTRKGRMSTTTIRRDFYKLTRPCEFDADCPHGREIGECEAATPAGASRCPSSFSTHPLRKWAIMRQLDAGVPKELLSDRVDVSVPVLDKHYDQRTEARKSERRREVLEANLEPYSESGGGSSIAPVDD